MATPIMRTGRGGAVNNAVVDYLVDIAMRTLMKRALTSAAFFVEATGRTAITCRDVYIGFIDAAHHCTLDSMRDGIADGPEADCAADPIDDDEEDVGSDDESSTGYESDSEDSSRGEADDDDRDVDVEEQFTTAIKPGLNDGAVRRASAMKRRLYEWNAFQPADAIQAAVRSAINKLQDADS